ncbi:MAG: heavy metal sensor histidine kinase, partial [Rubrivivax sp.]|nr:heavy metal sensor histidine kinase [Rubrivivax sp.]
MVATPCQTPCSHSISNRLSAKLALFTMLVLGVLFATSFLSIRWLVMEKNAEDLRLRSTLVKDILEFEAKGGGEDAVLARALADAAMRASSRLEIHRADGRVLYADPKDGAHALSDHCQTQDFTIAVQGGTPLQARLTMDFANEARMGDRWLLVLVIVTLAAGALVAVGTRWHVRRQLAPMRDLATQTRAISARRLDHRLSLADPAEELLPWIEQFNALMERLERAYAQLEAFNADVAHELRTPLATLIGETEVALSRERSAEHLRDTLGSNLEEMQRLSAMVNDMLFLSNADRGAEARRGQPVSLAEVAQQVAEFHEGTLDEAGLRLEVVGDATVAVDEPLIKRALSNLLGNATRFAEPGSTVQVRIAPEPEARREIEVVVLNRGQVIAPQLLPRLFDRFFRADESRCCEGTEQHHGLGLAIVAAIARMHAGRTLARSQGGVTEVGFTVA